MSLTTPRNSTEGGPMRGAVSTSSRRRARTFLSTSVLQVLVVLLPGAQIGAGSHEPRRTSGAAATLKQTV